MKKIRIISLGEIIPPNLGNGIIKLATMIAEKSGLEHGPLIARVRKVIEQHGQAIESFKQGLLVEADFDALMANAYSAEFEAELKGALFTGHDFTIAWNAMNPTYAVFANALNAALEFHQQENCQLVLISYTNPKDIRHFVHELQRNNVAYRLDANGHLCEVAGMALHTSYAKQTTKANLIKEVIVGLLSENPMNRLGFFGGHSPRDDIKYVRGVINETQLDALRKAFDEAVADSVQSVTNEFRVDSILWDKNSVSLMNILKHENPEHGFLSVAKL